MAQLLWALALIVTVLWPANGIPAETPPTPGVRILVVKTEAEARDALAAFHAGIPFERVVRERSIGPGAERGGYLIGVDPAALSPEVRGALAKTRRGQLSSVFRTQDGFAVIQVVSEQEEQELAARARRESEARELLKQGTALARRGDLEGAIALLQQAVEANPDLADAHFNLAIVYGRLNRLDAAMAAMREVIRRHPDDAEALMRLGGWLFDRGLYADACETYERAVTLHMDSGDAWLKLAQSYDAAGKPRAAVAAYRRVLGLLGRDDPAVLGALFRAAIRAEEGSAAVEAARKLRVFQPGREGFLTLGEALLTDGQPDAAAREFQMAAALAPTSVRAYAGLASAYARMGQAEAAAESFQRAIRLDPKDPELYRRLAHVYESMDRLDLAIVALRDGASAADTSPAALQAQLCEELAALYEKAGMSREAARERLRIQSLRSP